MSATTTPRFGVGPNQDNTGRVKTYDYKNPDYAATIALVPNAGKTYVVPKTLAGALTLTASTAQAFAADELIILFTADSSGRTVTFGTGFKTSGTLAVTASKFASASFVFDGVNWVETGRCITA